MENWFRNRNAKSNQKRGRVAAICKSIASVAIDYYKDIEVDDWLANDTVTDWNIGFRR